MQPMTGFDFIIAMADEAAKRDQPLAGQFLIMAQQAAIGRAGMVTEALAIRPLEADEPSPVSIVLGALEAARQQGDKESVDEVLCIVLSLLAKWADYWRSWSCVRDSALAGPRSGTS